MAVKKINYLVLTWFGCGRVPVAPGTAGSIGALPLCWLSVSQAGLTVRIIVAVLIALLGIFCAHLDQKTNTKHDPQYIVIDEVAGMLIATLLCGPNWRMLLIAFGIFRLLDVIKPFPANKFDQLSSTAVTSLGRAVGIVMDDVVAGMYTLGIIAGMTYYGLALA